MSRKEQIVDVARRLLEEHGPDGVTMRAIAERLDIRAPSLYKHIRDKGELEAALAAQGLVEQSVAFDEALAAVSGGDGDGDGDGDGHADAVAAIAGAYRRWALDNPRLYELMTANPLPRDQLPPGVEEAAVAPLLTAVGGDGDLARALWAFAHGMVSLELAGRFPPGSDLGPAWENGLRRLAG